MFRFLPCLIPWLLLWHGYLGRQESIYPKVGWLREPCPKNLGPHPIRGSLSQIQVWRFPLPFQQVPKFPSSARWRSPKRCPSSGCSADRFPRTPTVPYWKAIPVHGQYPWHLAVPPKYGLKYLPFGCWVGLPQNHRYALATPQMQKQWTRRFFF